MKNKALSFLFLTFSFTLVGQIGFQNHVIPLGHRATSDSDRFIPVDVDGDQDLDIFFTDISNYNEDNKCYSGLLEKNDSFNGFFKAKCIGILENGDSSQNIHAEDLDGDGDMDLIDTNSYYSGFNLSPSVIGCELRWYENIDGEGSFSEKKIISHNIRSDVNRIRTIDIDNDGDIDIVTAGSGLKWYENVDNFETIQEAKLISGSGSYDFLRIVDIDNDNDMDLIASVTYESGKIELYRNLDGKGSFGESEIIYSIETQYDDRLLPFILNDVDFDGDSDVIFLDRVNDEIAWCENTNGLGNFSDKINIPIEAKDLYRIYNGDLDGDGDDDLITESFGNISWFEKLDGDESFGIGQSIVNNHSANFNYDQDGNIAIADLNNDGRIDIMYKHSYNYDNNSYVAWLENKGLGNNEIRGYVRVDSNSDGCDITDTPSHNIGISTSSGTTFSRNNGFYQMFLSYGEFRVKPDFNVPNYFTITPESQVVNFSDLGNTEIVDFCLTANQLVNDINVIILPLSEARPGFDSSYELVIKNVGSSELTGEIKLDYNSDLTFLLASENPTNQSSNSLTFQFQNLKPFEDKKIEVSFNIARPPTIDISDTLVFDATLSPVLGDLTQTDNSYTLEQTVIGSYDPNDITILEGESITPEQAEGYLNYVIRFQNTGTASAINVRIEHEFDEKFDWTTFAPISSSHNNTINIKNGNQVEFDFQNINLPDSTSNEIESNGFVAFKIKPKANLPVWDFLNATANIYFDFNPPITTNTAVTQVQGEILPFEASLIGVIDVTCLNSSTSYGSVSFNVSGGLPPYEYELLNSSGNSIRKQSDRTAFSNLNDGNYSVIIKDYNNDSIAYDFEVKKYSGPYISFSNVIVTDVTCIQGTNGIIEINPSGGFPPYRYRIDGGEFTTSNVFTNLPAKQYRIEVIDSYGCSDTLSPTIRTSIDSSVNCEDYDNDGILNENDNCPTISNSDQVDLNNNGIGDECEDDAAIKISTVRNNVTCFGAKDGNVEVNPTNGTPPYQYALLDRNRNLVVPWQNNNLIEGIESGNYVLRVMDSESLITATILTITQPSLLSAKVEVLSTGNSNTIMVIADGGIAPYQYQISDNGFIEDNNFENISPGEYEIEVIDARGCNVIVSTQIIEENTATFIATSTIISNISCKGLNDAIIDVNVSGGVEPYTYELLNENDFVIFSSQESDIFENLPMGNYKPRVTDAAIQQVTGAVITITNPASPDFDNDGLGDACDDDIDGDGIPNNLDDCAATPLGTDIDNSGCVKFSLPNTNFSVQAVGETCASSNNGSILVTAIENLDYTATLIYGSTTIDKDFRTFVAFQDLEAGAYDVCIKVASEPNFEQCFNINISQPEPLDIDAKVDTTGKSITLKMKGGENYTISINDVIYQTTSEEIILPLSDTQNNVQIKTDKDCQGVYEEMFLIDVSEILIFPNPVVGNEVSVQIPHSYDENIHLTLYANDGRMVARKIEKSNGAPITLNVSGLTSGIYNLNIETGNKSESRRIIIK